jgi:hypothetical protein
MLSLARRVEGVARSANVSDLGNNLSQLCFSYPEHLVGRKHGPRGYAHYEGYRGWLRDEFAFRCAYCLMREGWLRGQSGFQIDHCIPQAQDPSRKLDYDNLAYTCPWCNLAKSGVPVPNPMDVAYGSALVVNMDGAIQAKNDLGVVLIAGLRLDNPQLTDQRRLLVGIVRLAEEKNNLRVILKLLGYPDDLPELKHKRPPAGNTRPAGILHSAAERRRRGELPSIY